MRRNRERKVSPSSETPPYRLSLHAIIRSVLPDITESHRKPGGYSWNAGSNSL